MEILLDCNFLKSLLDYFYYSTLLFGCQEKYFTARKFKVSTRGPVSKPLNR
jgi:hypothetical protein